MQLFDFADKYRGKYDSSITVAQKYYRSISGYNVRCWAQPWACFYISVFGPGPIKPIQFFWLIVFELCTGWVAMGCCLVVPGNQQSVLFELPWKQWWLHGWNWLEHDWVRLGCQIFRCSDPCCQGNRPFNRFFFFKIDNCCSWDLTKWSLALYVLL